MAQGSEIDEILKRIVIDSGFAPNRLEHIRASVTEARARGYAVVHDRVTRGVSAIGVAIMNSLGSPLASVTVAAIHERMKPPRIKSLAVHLKA